MNISYENKQHQRELLMLRKKIENARPRIHTQALLAVQHLPRQIVQRTHRQRQAKYKVIEKENQRLLRSLCEIARRPSKNLVDMHLYSPTSCCNTISKKNNTAELSRSYWCSDAACSSSKCLNLSSVKAHEQQNVNKFCPNKATISKSQTTSSSSSLTPALRINPVIISSNLSGTTGQKIRSSGK